MSLASIFLPLSAAAPKDRAPAMTANPMAHKRLEVMSPSLR